ncbi:hypothetical protein GCM10008119_26420 [Pedobacter mendelii]|uniref:Uncharacterized protein n=1 Tax=Pedobacter mendelii TaxID=1908240 RepID=A0ABQ2BIX4_9SPHI|nr:hypothetical protein GCM10008119_26420 [Pedobacter mendelii]
MKANHNSAELILIVDDVVVNISISKNESKSQLKNRRNELEAGCCKYQYLKE